MSARDVLRILGVEAFLEADDLTLKVAQTLERRRLARHLLVNAALPAEVATVAMAVGGITSGAVASASVNADAAQREALIDFAQAQLGDVTLGDVAGRDLIKNITIIVNPPGAPDEPAAH